MDRSKIKVVEFGDEARQDAHAKPMERDNECPSSARTRDEGIKIKEFGYGADQHPGYVARPEDMSSIKIVEFDNEPLPYEEEQRHNQGASKVGVPSPAEINVFEYDDQGQLIEKKEKETRHNGIKIVEF